MKNELEKLVEFAEESGTDNATFTVELYKRNDGISVEVSFNNCSSEPIHQTVKTVDEVGEAVSEMIKSTASWM